jgi:hypothetical protein
MPGRGCVWDGVRDLAGIRIMSTEYCAECTDRAPRDILQSAVAYSWPYSPWSTRGMLGESPAEGITTEFLWVILPSGYEEVSLWPPEIDVNVSSS